MSLTDSEQARIAALASRARVHMETIEQTVPEQSFVVGGSVRDAILGLDASDMDFVIVGETVESMESMGFERIEASSFPVFHDSEHEEWALARTEQKVGSGYDGFEVETDSVSLRDDLERRDLRCNAIALDPHGDGDWGIHDPFDGVSDTQNGVLRHVSDAFAEDPLRVLRVARFAGRFAVPTDEAPVQHHEMPDGSIEDAIHRFAAEEPSVVHPGFRVADATMDMMRSCVPELNRMSRDRIGTELRKAMRQARRPSRVWEVLRDCGALAVLWPELDLGEVVLAGPPEHHAEGSVFDHTMMVLDRMDRLCIEHDIDGVDRERRLWMALAHDIGKVVVAMEMGGIHSDDPPMGFPDHASKGAETIDRTARRLGLGNEISSVMSDACKHHMNIHQLTMMPANELLEFIGSAFPVGVDGDGMRELPTNEDGDPHSFFGATAWELVDVGHADHEGRLKRVSEDNISGTDLTRTSVERPEFEREPFVRTVEAVFEAEHSVDGYEALERGLCDRHNNEPIDRTHGCFEASGESVSATMSACDACRTPGDWVGDMLAEMKQDRVREVLQE